MIEKIEQSPTELHAQCPHEIAEREAEKRFIIEDLLYQTIFDDAIIFLESPLEPERQKTRRVESISRDPRIEVSARAENAELKLEPK